MALFLLPKKSKRGIIILKSERGGNMDLREIRNKAINLYNEGKNAQEISKQVGMELGEELIKKWAEEEKIEKYKSIIFILNKEQMKEKDYNKKKEKSQELKEKIEEILKMIPEDTDMLIKLMYTDINLNQCEEARKIGYKLYETTKTKDVLRGLSIIEEKLGNYDNALKFLEEILQKEPNNEYIKIQIDKVKSKQEKTNKITERTIDSREYKYRQISDLERQVRKLAEQEQEKNVIQGNNKKFEEILEEKYMEAYGEVAQIANSILIEYPQEILAREKLVKALFITKNKLEAEQEARDLLQINQNDEIALWYISKINRERKDLYGEKQCLEKLIEGSQPNTQIKAQKRLEEVKNLIERYETEQELEKARQESYTEETRQEFIENLKQEFLEGKINLDNISQKIAEAKKYPNFTQSLIQILDIKAKMTGNLQDKIHDLETYTETTQTLTPEQYNMILDEIAKTREQDKMEKQIEKAINRKYEAENYELSNDQRQYSKQIIERLNKGKIAQEDLPEIAAKLQTFPDRAKAIFLITKLYEIVYDREEAYKNLSRYTHIANLSDFEKREIASLQKILMEEERTTGGTHRIKKVYLKKEENERQKYKKKSEKQEIIELLNQNKTVAQIHQMLKEKGVSLKSIARVKTFYLRENEVLRAEQLRLELYARNLIKEGYQLKDIYAIMEYDIPMPKLQQIERSIKQKQQGGEEL